MKKFLRYFFAFVLITAVVSLWAITEPFIAMLGYGDMNIGVLTKNDNYTIVSKDYLFAGKSIDVTELNKNTVNAFLAAEDKRFYEHEGVDYARTVAAAVKDIKEKKFAQGGSTITQQLAKNMFLSSEKTLKRKIKEIRFAKAIERKLTKNQILTAYLNNLYFGNGIYGIQNAANSFFNKNASNLTTKESAILAATINNPTVFSPYKERNEVRVKTILKRMKDCGYISDIEYELSLSEKTTLMPENGESKYWKSALEEAKNILGVSMETLKTGGYKIVCNYDKNISIAAKNLLPKDTKTRILVLKNNNGQIIAYESNCDVGIYAKRSPASTIKPLVCYAPMLENEKILPCSPILDESVDFDGYAPKNYKGKYNGWVSCGFALKESLNVPAVKLLEEYGVEKGKAFLKKFGIETEKNEGLALALGGMKYGVEIPNLAAAYATFANDGMYTEAKIVSEIQKNGITVYKRYSAPTQIIKSTTAYYINEMLNDCASNGTAKSLSATKFNLAAKTGTAGTGEVNTDSYCVAYNTDYTVIVHAIDSAVSGGGLPTEIAKSLFMTDINSEKCFNIPDSIKKIYLDADEYYQNHRLVKSAITDKLKDKILVSASIDFPIEQKKTNLAEILSPYFDNFSRFYRFFY